MWARGREVTQVTTVGVRGSGRMLGGMAGWTYGWVAYYRSIYVLYTLVRVLIVGMTMEVVLN